MTSESIYAAGQHPSFYENLPHTGVTTDGIPHTPYVYMISWNNPEMNYIGSSYGKKSHPFLFWNKDSKFGYFTSSNHVKSYTKTFGEPDTIKILSIHNTRKEAIIEENRLLSLNDAAKNNKFLNKTNGSINFEHDNTGFMVAMENDSYEYKSIHVNQYNRSTHKTPASGKNVVIDTLTNKTLSIDSKTYKESDRYISVSKDMVGVFDTFTNQSISISCSEYHANKDRYLHASTDMVVAYDLTLNDFVKIPTDTYRAGKGIKYSHASSNKIAVTNVSTGERIVISTEEYVQNKDIYKFHTTAMMPAILIETGEFVHISVEDYKKFPNLYKSNNEDKVAAFDKRLHKRTLIDVHEYENNKTLYEHHTTDLVSAILRSSGKSIMVSRNEYHSNKHLYKTANTGISSTTKNKSPHINSKGKLKYFTKDSAEDGFHLAKFLYNRHDGTCGWNFAALLISNPEDYAIANKWYDKQNSCFCHLPKDIAIKEPHRYFNCWSQEYKDFKKSQS